MGVVATTLVREARSKSVWGVTLKSPLLAKDARNGAPSFGVGEWESESPLLAKDARNGAPTSCSGDSAS